MNPPGAIDGHEIAAFLFERGAEARDGGRPREALEWSDTALRVSRLLRLDRHAAACQLLMGDCHEVLGEYEEAIRACLAARLSFEALGIQRASADCDQIMGIAYRHLSRFPDAVLAHSRARATYDALGLARDVAASDQNLGLVNLRLMRTDEGVRLLQRAREAFQETGDSAGVADCSLNLGIAFLSESRLAESKELLLSARAFFRAPIQPEALLTCDTNIAALLMAQGHFEQALDLYNQVSRLCALLGMSRASAVCAVNKGVVCRKLGRPGESLGYYREARAMFQALDLDLEVAQVDWDTGNQVLDQDPRGAEQALAWWLPALLYLDSLRFQFAKPADRQHWATTIAGKYQAVFDLAAQARNTELIAELVTNAINSGIHTTGPTNAEPGVDDDTLSRQATATMITAHLGTGDHPTTTLTTTAVTAIAGSDQPLTPPPLTIHPYHRPTLHTHRHKLTTDYHHTPPPGQLQTW